MEVTIGFVLLVIVGIIVAVYYGMGRNLEVGTRMITRELEDAERMQVERIVKKYASKSKDQISDADFKKAVSAIARIDDLDI